MTGRYDVAVIGSGFGGAVTACRLAQAGRSVCVLERGRRWRKEEFPRTVGQTTRAFWDPARSYGLLEYRAFRKIDVVQGCGVGGGSLHFFNVQFEPSPEIFRQPAWPRALAGGALAPYYALVREMLDSRPLEPPAGRALPPRTQAFLAAARAAGRKPALVPIAVHTGPDRENPHGGAAQGGCVYCGNCMLGCHVHAKNTLDLNYVPLAERHGAEVRALHEVERIVPLDGQGYRLDCRRSDDGAVGRWEPCSLTADQVVVAAGTLGSTELLLRCRDVHRTLPRLGRALGRRFSGNGDFLLAGTKRADRAVDPAAGPSITAFADFSTARHRITIEDLGYPDPMFWLLEGVIPTERRFHDTWQLLRDYVLRTLGIARASSRVSDGIEAILEGGETTRFLPYLGMGSDAADGKMRLRGGALDIDWSHRRSRRLFAEIEDAMRQLSRALDGRYVTSVLWRWPVRKLLTAHPLGGCVAGESPSSSVVDDRGRVWGHPGLLVADGSVIPTALAVNPSMTIAALAERTAFWMLHGRELATDDGQRPATR